MGRMRIWCKVAVFWNPCIFAQDMRASDSLVGVIESVCKFVPALTCKWEPKIVR